jgi:hypothetical protein
VGSPAPVGERLPARLDPVLIAVGWVVVAHQPHGNWPRHHVLAWSGSIHIRSLVDDLTGYVGVLASEIGLVFGYSFDTSGPRRRAALTDRRRDIVTAVDRRTADEPITAERQAATTGTRSTGSRFGLRRRRRQPVAADGTPRDETTPTRTSKHS